MKKTGLKAGLIALASVFVFPVVAADNSLQAARKIIAAKFDNVKMKDITPSTISGLYEVIVPPRLYYVSGDGKYIFSGDIVNIETSENISRLRRNEAVRKAVAAQGEDSMIIFGDKSLKHTITVFTDIDCAYCRKLHSEIEQYNKKGIRIRYLAYPRAGLGSSSFKKAEAVWCSDDRNAAMTRAKNDLPVKSKTCNSPVAAHYKLGNDMGIRGTPALILEDGSVVPGYIPPDRLAAGLEQMKK